MVRKPVGRTGPGRSRVSSARRRAKLLTGAAAVAMLVAGSVILLRPDAKSGPLASAPTSSPAAMSQRTSSAAAAARPSDPLGYAAMSYVARRSGAVLGAVYDERTGQLWTLGRGGPQAEASIVKVDILETLLAQHGAAKTVLSADEVKLAQEMIKDSDNNAATALWDEVGGAQGIGAYNRAVGLTNTKPSGCISCPGFAWPGWGLSTTTAADQIALLRELLQRSSHLTAAQQAFALGLMEGVTPAQRWGVTMGVATSATVALKNGWLPLTSANNDWQVNSVGWISGGGRDYLIAVLTTGNPTEQYGIDTIDNLSAIVWHEMG